MTSRRLLIWAFLASLLVHLVVGALTWNLDFLRGGASAQAAVDRAVELVLTPDEQPASPAPPDPTRPTAYTEIPERLQSEAPDRADFLAMFNARAADRRPGGEQEDQPGADVAAEAPQVEFVRPCNLCPHMKRITLPKILDALVNMTGEVLVDPTVGERAKAAVERMIHLKN